MRFKHVQFDCRAFVFTVTYHCLSNHIDLAKTFVRVVLYYQINIDPDLMITSVRMRHLFLNGCFSHKVLPNLKKLKTIYRHNRNNLQITVFMTNMII